MPSRAIQVNYSIEKVAKSFIIFWLWTTRRCFPSQEIRYVISSLIDPSRFLWCLVLQLCAVARRLYQQQKNKGNHHQQLKEQEQPPPKHKEASAANHKGSQGGHHHKRGQPHQCCVYFEVNNTNTNSRKLHWQSEPIPVHTRTSWRADNATVQKKSIWTAFPMLHR